MAERPPPDLKPCKLVEHGPAGSFPFSLIFDDFGPCTPVFEAHDSDGGGYAWHRAAVGLLTLYAPDDLPRVNFDSESSMFVAHGPDREALERLAHLIGQVQTDHAMLERALEEVNLEDYD